VSLLHSLPPHRLRRYWLGLCLFLVLVICWLAFHPKPPHFTELPNDKVNHLLAFASLGFTGALSRQRGWRAAVAVVVALVAFGGFIEIVQTYIPGRAGEWGDLVADSVGIAIGLALAAAWRWLGQKYF
jgi:VanZ family protein